MPGPSEASRTPLGSFTLTIPLCRKNSELAGSPAAGMRELHEAGQTAIALGEGDRVLALFGLADQLRPEAAQLAARLRDVGVRQLVMLTGDSEPVARAVARRAGIDAFRAGLLPADKLAAVEAMRREQPVAMVGDGVNDAALAAADVGVAMGAAGSDAALESADVALMSDRLDRLPEAIGGARRARSVMRVNVIASLVVKGAFVLLAPFGLVTLVLAVAADMGMSLLVTLNALPAAALLTGAVNGGIEGHGADRASPDVGRHGRAWRGYCAPASAAARPRGRAAGTGSSGRGACWGRIATPSRPTSAGSGGRRPTGAGRAPLQCPPFDGAAATAAETGVALPDNSTAATCAGASRLRRQQQPVARPPRDRDRHPHRPGEAEVRQRVEHGVEAGAVDQRHDVRVRLIRRQLLGAGEDLPAQQPPHPGAGEGPRPARVQRARDPVGELQRAERARFTGRRARRAP